MAKWMCGMRNVWNAYLLQWRPEPKTTQRPTGILLETHSCGCRWLCWSLIDNLRFEFDYSCLLLRVLVLCAEAEWSFNQKNSSLRLSIEIFHSSVWAISFSCTIHMLCGLWLGSGPSITCLAAGFRKYFGILMEPSMENERGDIIFITNMQNENESE